MIQPLGGPLIDQYGSIARKCVRHGLVYIMKKIDIV
jgi:hypothetical protein